MSFFSKLFEKLNKPIYSDKELDDEKSKNTSQTADKKDIEYDGIGYDPFSYSVSNYFGQRINVSFSHSEYLKKWRNAALFPEVDDAIEEIINEAIVFDSEEDTISIDLSTLELSKSIKNKIQESFEKIMYLLDFSQRGDELFRQWYVDGLLNIESVYDQNSLKSGIKKLIVLSPFNFLKMVNEQTGEITYKYEGQYSGRDLKKVVEKTFLEDQISRIVSGIWEQNKFFPLSFLNKSLKTINQLGLIEESLIIFRITRSPEKRVFYVDTGNLPKTKAEEYVKSLISKYRQRKIYNTDSGTIENKSNQISILEDFWFPSAQGSSGTKGTRVETLTGQNPGFNSFEDVDYFLNKLYRSLGIPPNRRNNSGERFEISNVASIEKDELKFYKSILKLRRKFNNLFIDLLKKDLLAKKVLSLQEWKSIQENIKFKYSSNNEFFSIKKLQMLDNKINSASQASQLVSDGVISTKFIQKRILNLTEEEIAEIEQDSKKEPENAEDEYESNKKSEIEPTEEIISPEFLKDDLEKISYDDSDEDNDLKILENMIRDGIVKDGDYFTDSNNNIVLYKNNQFKIIKNDEKI